MTFFRWHRWLPRWVASVRSISLTAWIGCLGAPGAGAAEPAGFTFRTNDVVALVGGEDVVEMQRNGYLELLLTAALPHHQLRFRNLAFEGDTVFEQHRQLNFPSWEKQLERVGATVVVAQFGQAESLEGTKGLGRFIQAYTKLLQRFTTNSGRRLVLLSPTPFEKVPGALSDLELNNVALQGYAYEVGRLAANHAAQFVNLLHVRRGNSPHSVGLTRDGLHLNQVGQWESGKLVAISLNLTLRPWGLIVSPSRSAFSIKDNRAYVGTGGTPEELRQLILEKNRLWFDYWRPQNWAFLHGDRTDQASSRDHRDPKKRWFPEEMEKFLPLIAAKEREIWEAAGKLR